MKREIKLIIIIVIILLLVVIFASSGSTRTKIKQKGSDTMLEVAQIWAEEYVKVNDNVTLSVSGGGSGTGIAQMINGQIDIADASRPIKKYEIAIAQTQGIVPVELEHALMALQLLQTMTSISLKFLLFNYAVSTMVPSRIGMTLEVLTSK